MFINLDHVTFYQASSSQFLVIFVFGEFNIWEKNLNYGRLYDLTFVQF
jgi:hypothetical protein